MKFSKLAFAAALAVALPTALAAQDLTVGATVYGSDGAAVGTIVESAGGVTTIDTGKHRAALPDEGFGAGDNGPTIGVTKAEFEGQIDAMLAEQKAQLDAALVAGAAVADVDGAALGTIGSIAEDNVVIESPHGAFALKPDSFSLRDGKLTAAVRAADVEAQLKATTAG